MFDEDHLVPNAGLVASALLAQRLGIAERVDRRCVWIATVPARPTAGSRR
jgi:hypothetical protein